MRWTHCLASLVCALIAGISGGSYGFWTADGEYGNYSGEPPGFRL